jgi:cytoskeletal protein RodZ
MHQAKHSHKLKLSKPLVAAIAVILLAIILYFISNASGDDNNSGYSKSGNNSANSNSGSSANGTSNGSGNSSKSSSATGSLSLSSPSSPTKKVAKDSTLTLEVWADSGAQSVNALQVNLSYPQEKLSFIKVDGSGSAFTLDAQSSGGNGTVKIARGNIKPISGRLLVAKVQFKALDDSGNATVTFDKSSVLISSTTNKNILGKTDGATYTLSQ